MTRSRRGAVALLLITTITASASAPTVAEPPAPGPGARKLYIVTDSVGLGARSAFSTAFPGWQVTLDGDAGEFTETLERKYVRPRLTTTPGAFGDYAIVAAGYNYPYWDPARFDRSIDTMIATLTEAGVKHVFWMTLREIKPQYISAAAWRQIQPYYWYFPRVNEHLHAALDRHTNLSLIDFAAVADQPGLTYDAIHLTPGGAALYTGISRQAIVDATTSVPEMSVTRVAIPNPAGVAAVALNLTTTAPRAAGFLTAYDCDQPQPEISNHNYGRAEVVAHSVIAGVSDAGEVCILARRATNVIVDITGRFTTDAGVKDAAPARLIDTRNEGAHLAALSPRPIPLGSAAGVSALSVTALDASQPGWVRAAPCDATSETSTVNVTSSAPIPNMALVATEPDAEICVTVSTPMHVLVDRFVSFDAGPALSMRDPERVLDTRVDGAARLAPGTVVTLDSQALGIDATATGVMLNLVATDAGGPGFLTAYPCAAGSPPTSSLNYGIGATVANFVIVAPDANGEVCIATLTATHVVVDMLGTTGPGFVGGAPERLLDTRLANLPVGWP